MLKELGRLNEAEASYGKTIVLKPDFAEAHLHLALMKKFDSEDEQYSKMQKLYLNENISEQELCHINFGLAKACEDLEDFEQAFQHYREGNELRKNILNYDISQDVELFNQLKNNYPLIEQNSLKSESLTNKLMPIFIVGMPRSGTTLVEQIISSHSEVTGAGELSFASEFGGAIARGLSELNIDTLLDFRERYLIKLQNFSKGNLIVTDKMPQNFYYIGLLAATFPEAKIVHVKRNPAAVCWANYKTDFVSNKMDYCNELDNIIKYYGLYKNLMEFWAKQLPNRIYDADYELFTVNQEDETRKLINYIGLDWEDKCLLPQDNTRSVATASTIQIRKKVYQGSSQQWEKYKPFLNGALDGLLAP
jgi:tetratricopeptide (TPR) repeat protein